MWVMECTGKQAVMVEREAMWWRAVRRERQAGREIVDVLSERLIRKCDVIVDFGVGNDDWRGDGLSGGVRKILAMTSADEFVKRGFGRGNPVGN